MTVPNIKVDGGLWGFLFIAVVIAVIWLVVRYRTSPASRSSSKGDDQKPAKPVVALVAPATKHAEKHDAGHGGGHGHQWSFTDGVIAAVVVILIGGLVAALFWAFGSLSSSQESSASRPTVAIAVPTVDPHCITTTQPQFCFMTPAGQDLVLAPGLHAGMTFCITPDINESKLPEEQRVYKSVTRILKTGEIPAYDHAHLLANTVIGYTLVPKKPIKVRHFMAETPDAAGC